ncbi:uncharacterized protein B0H18DRAFT_979865 [Fomitopsis serialis]|uniref:uncharacterized protein n=1 Tax=Fomitopsis serialis TaxID=139415 RepID=UPI002008AF29|nr:uncharacterized protein B0H18DRAFT_979865 [Neoantrodia serialis]KAH9934186.1 hypothetical protein B0H18DRAFT_979865 [Neoantrodia serialis]
MRCALALTTLLSALATVQASYLLRRQFPSCAESCLADANFDGCNSSDDTCLCKSSAFVNSVTSCIQSSCTGNDLTTAESDAQQLCLAVGVTLASSGASATSTSPSSSTSSAASSASATSASSGARTHGVNALAGLAAVGAVAFAF